MAACTARQDQDLLDLSLSALNFRPPGAHAPPPGPPPPPPFARPAPAAARSPRAPPPPPPDLPTRTPPPPPRPGSPPGPPAVASRKRPPAARSRRPPEASAPSPLPRRADSHAQGPNPPLLRGFESRWGRHIKTSAIGREHAPDHGGALDPEPLPVGGLDRADGQGARKQRPHDPPCLLRVAARCWPARPPDGRSLPGAWLHRSRAAARPRSSSWRVHRGGTELPEHLQDELLGEDVAHDSSRSWLGSPPRWAGGACSCRRSCPGPGCTSTRTPSPDRSCSSRSSPRSVRRTGRTGRSRRADASAAVRRPSSCPARRWSGASAPAPRTRARRRRCAAPGLRRGSTRSARAGSAPVTVHGSDGDPGH